MPSNTIQTYLSKITSEHAGRPRFVKFVTSLLQPLVDSQTFFQTLITAFDLDTAVGVQLDAVGKWIGRTRQVDIPLSGVYFAFDTANLGWDQGSWQGQFDPNTGLTNLDDTSYRLLLKAKVIMNHWDGSIPMAAAALTELFGSTPGTVIAIQDNQDMSMNVTISGQVPSAVIISLLKGGYVPIVPEGVNVNYLITSSNGQPIFGWDVNNSTVAGWDTGAWDGQAGAPPGQTTGLSYSSVNSSGATFSWIAPTTGSGPFTYQLQYQLGSSGSGTWVNEGSPVKTTQETVNNLSAEQTYSFQVYAINGGGAGTPSQFVTFTTAAGLPAKVTGLHITSTTVSSVALSWNAVTGNNIVYQVSYRVSGTTTFNTFSTTISSTSENVTGLSQNTTYDFKVFAQNNTGAGPDSDIISGGTSGSTPGVIQNLTVSSIGQTDVSLTWGQPVTNNGPYSYSVQYAKNTNPVTYQTFSGTVTTTSTGGTCDVTGLTAGQDYLFTVTASNSSGNGPVSGYVEATANNSSPSAPSSLSVSNVTSSSVVLTWPSANGASTYQVQSAPLYAPSKFANQGTAVSTTTSTITGLSSGAGYVFRVLGVSASNVQGPASPTQAAVTTGVSPGQVTGLAIGTVTNNSIAISWTAPSTGTGNFSYQIQYQVSGSGWIDYGSPVTSLSQTLSNLQNGLSYTITVFAINDFGQGSQATSKSVTLTGGSNPVTWSSTDHTPDIIVSNNNLTVTSTTSTVTNFTASSETSNSVSLTWSAPNSSGFFGVRGTQSLNAGKVFVEFTLTAVTQDFAIGLANSNWGITSSTTGVSLGTDSNSLGIYPNK